MRELKIHFEGGLHGTTPSKCPLSRHSQLTPVGDTYSEVTSPEVFD